MADVREEVIETYSELLEILWQRIKEAKNLNQQKDTNEIIETFKDEYANDIQALQDKNDGKPITKEFIINHSHENIDKLSRQFDDSNQQSLDMVKMFKQSLSSTEKLNDEQLTYLDKIERNSQLQKEYKDQIVKEIDDQKVLNKEVFDSSIIDETYVEEKGQWNKKETLITNTYENRTQMPSGQSNVPTSKMLKELKDKGVVVKHLGTREDIIHAYSKYNTLDPMNKENSAVNEKNNENTKVKEHEKEYEEELELS